VIAVIFLLAIAAAIAIGVGAEHTTAQRRGSERRIERVEGDREHDRS